MDANFTAVVFNNPVAHRQTESGALPRVPAFVDSPLAIDATNVYRLHPENLRDDLREDLYAHEDPFGFGRLRYTRTVEESKAINSIQGPAIIISANGMAEAGRVLHHLRQNIEDERNSIVFVGYQAENTLGRRVVEKQPYLKIFDRDYTADRCIRQLRAIYQEVLSNRQPSVNIDERWTVTT